MSAVALGVRLGSLTHRSGLRFKKTSGTTSVVKWVVKSGMSVLTVSDGRGGLIGSELGAYC